MSKSCVLVVGDIMLDRYVHGVVERISPEAPIPILRKTRIEDRPGGAANLAANLASLGAEVSLVGAIGADGDGDALGVMCGAMGRRYLTLNAPGGKTTVKQRYVCDGYQMLRVDQDGGRPTERALGDIDQAAFGMLKTSDAMVLSDYAGGVLDNPRRMIDRARELGVPVYVDPKGTDWERYRGATLIKPNESELRAVVGDWFDHGNMLMRAKRLLAELSIDSALITLGANGMTLVVRDGEMRYQKSVSGPVVDVTGAGDTVMACVVDLRAQGLDWPEVLEMAARGAAAVCARHGTSIVTTNDMGLETETA